jgi:hypothetical protein
MKHLLMGIGVLSIGLCLGYAAAGLGRPHSAVQVPGLHPTYLPPPPSGMVPLVPPPYRPVGWEAV